MMWRRLIFLVTVVFVLGLFAPAGADAATDPNLALWYKLDESGSTKNVPDSSLYGRNGTIETWPAALPVNWDPGDGHDGGCLVFDDDTRINTPKSALSTVTTGITVSLWLKDAWRLGQNWTFDAAVGGDPDAPGFEQLFRIAAAIGTAPDAEVLWRAGNDTNDAVRWDAGNVQELEGWHLWTFVKDEIADYIRIYLDGSVATSKSSVDNTLTTVLPIEEANDAFVFHIGAASTHYNHLKGRVDEFRVYDKALSDDEVERLYYADGDPNVAWKPDPVDGAENLCDDVVLSWSVGDYADEHDVYFGTDGDNVESATPISGEYRLRQGPNSYDAASLETLDPGVTYYWRIDEVNDNIWAPPGSPWKGQVWEFTINDNNAFDPGPEDGETAVLKETLLSWSAGCRAAEHKVYFSTDVGDVESRDADAYLGQIGSTSIDPCAQGDLEYLTDYYWVVDEVNGATTWSGQVWSFTSQTQIIDPNNTLWYKLDEMGGYVAYDSSNFQNDAIIDIPGSSDPPEWVADGRWGGALDVADGTGIWVPTPVLSRITNGVAIIFWTNGQNNPILNANGGDSQLMVDFQGDYVSWRAGNDSSDVLRWYYPGSEPTGWHCWGFVKDEVAGNMVIYFDGEPAESNSVGTSNLAGVRSKPFKICAETHNDGDFSGDVDDFIVYDRALSGNEILRQYETGGPVGKVELAWNADPRNGAVDVYRDANLAWSPGDFTVEHDVYLGTDWYDVNDATTATASIYKGRQDPCEYDPASYFELNTTYYWRIDEVNDPCVWKGNVWRFTTANFLVIDDFESYDASSNPIRDTWEDSFVNWTGSYIDLAEAPIYPVNTLSQSMEYSYDNTSKWDFISYWSLAELPFGSPQDWTELDMKTLTLYLYGHPDNDIGDTEQLYVDVNDDPGGHAEIPYPDMNDLLLEEWTEWNIPISDFNNPNDIDETQVTWLSLVFGSSSNTTIQGGDGIVYFDDIRLYPSRCVPSIIKPYADLSNNCIVDWPDVRIMGEQWLRTDANLNPVSNPGSANLVGHWKLDGDANDASVYANHGTIMGSYSWVAGPNNQAAKFTDGRVWVWDAPELRPLAWVSAACWLYYSGNPGDAARVVVKGRNDREAYCIEMGDDDSFTFYVGDTNGTRYWADSNKGDTYPDEWIHLAGTYDGTTAKSWVNGQVVGSVSAAAIPLSQDSNGLAIANKADAEDNPLNATVDEVRVYNRALTAAEVGYLATDGSGYVPLNSLANIYDAEPAGEQAVNIKDIAVLLAAWLDKTYWP